MFADGALANSNFFPVEKLLEVIPNIDFEIKAKHVRKSQSGTQVTNLERSLLQNILCI